MWGEAICTTKHNELTILHQTASYLAVDVEFTLIVDRTNWKRGKLEARQKKLQPINPWYSVLIRNRRNKLLINKHQAIYLH